MMGEGAAMDKKKVLVTGAGRGIGRAIALAAAKAGYEVIAHYNRSSKAAAGLLEEIEASGGTCSLIQFDISDRADCRQKLEALWEEQGHKCLYTGDEIGIFDFLGANPKYDIEHTVPRSAGGDSSKMNLTLCSNRYNRDVKKTKLPSQLSNHEEILERISDWKKQYEDLDRQIRKIII